MENDNSTIANTLKRMFCCFVTLFAAVLFCFLFQQMMLRLYCRQAAEALRLSQLSVASSSLELAKSWMGTFTNSSSRVLYHLVQGDYLLAKADKTTDLKNLLSFTQQSAEEFEKALELSLLNIDGYIGLATATETLERLYPFIEKRPYKQQALPIYLKLQDLMPASVYSQSLLVKYYLSRNMKDELNESIAEIVRIYPPIYFELKQQYFYSKSMHSRIKVALEKAIDDEVCLNQANQAISDIFFEELEYKKAIEWYRKSAPSAHNDVAELSYILKLGFLQLKANQLLDARSTFLYLVKSKKKDEVFYGIYKMYLDAKLLEQFFQFCMEIQQQGIQYELLLLLQAKGLIILEKDELAKAILIKIKENKYIAESNYLLSQIAERQQDWDQMELKSQQAIANNSINTTYIMQLSRALQIQKKFEQAEFAVDRAIAVSKEQNAWFYNHRAWLRWAQKKYDGAKEDWDRAIKLSPQSAELYYSLAQVYEQTGKFDDAVRNAKMAVELQPENKQFRNKLHILETKANSLINAMQ